MSNKGWIKLHRKLQDCWIWQIDNSFDERSAWIDMLLSANHKDVKILFSGELTFVKRGQFITSIRKLSERWKWNKDKVLKFLKILEKDGMIIKSSDRYRTLVTIENYDFYQIEDDTERTPSGTPLGTENGTPLGTQQGTEQVHEPATNKNEKNEENEKNIRVSKDTLCQTQDVRRVLEEWNTLSEYGIKSVSKVNSGSRRYQNLVARIKQYSVEDVLKAIDNIRHSDFLQGKHGGRPWQVTFDWFVLPNNFPKVLDGNYVDSKETTDLSIKGNTNLDEGPVDWTVV